VEEAAAASESLVEQAESLMEVVSVFNLGNQAVQDRRAINSPMRTTNKTNQRTDVARTINRKTLKIAMNGSMNDGSWEEF
jgi:methyl-accepting chemotaxis protein